MNSGMIMRAAEFVESYFDAWNHRDPKGVADHLAANGIYRDIPENAQQTHDELITSLSDFFANNQHQYELIGEILTGDNTIAYQYRINLFDVTRENESPRSYNGAEFMTLNGDAAITITDYYDSPGKERPTELARMTKGRAQNHKYAKSGLSDEQLLEYKRRLDNVMVSQKVYLRSNVTLPGLAEIVNCSSNHLSQVINSGFGMSFFDYLNRYRIEHAQQLLTARDIKGSSILNIAFTVGFNSNSAFYAAFKRCVGQTPAQFRRTQLKQSS
jgi:AraC-like DNA-binding protein/nuclear transport factor 2 (NTF2) superfamily protein